MWPGLTVKAVTKHFPESNETTKGHGRKIRSGLHSTTRTAGNDSSHGNNKDNQATAGVNPPPRPATQTREIFHTIYDLDDDVQLKMYTNQMGRFPRKSSCGNQYIMVLIELNSNAILVEAMKNRSATEMIRAYQVLVDRLCSAGMPPKLHLLDNECSADFKEKIKSNKVSYQLVPPHYHIVCV